MNDIVKRLRVLSGMTAMGEPIKFGSDSRAMDQAADRIEQLEAALRKIACDGEPYDKCHCVNSEECSYGIARAALGEKKDG